MKISKEELIEQITITLDRHKKKTVSNDSEHEKAYDTGFSDGYHDGLHDVITHLEQL